MALFCRLDARPRSDDQQRSFRVFQIVQKTAFDHPHHVVNGLIALANGGHARLEPKAAAAREILAQLANPAASISFVVADKARRERVAQVITGMQLLSKAYLDLAAVRCEKTQLPQETKLAFELSRIHEARHPARGYLPRLYLHILFLTQKGFYNLIRQIWL